MSTRHPDTLKVVQLLALLSSHMLGREFGHFVTMAAHKVHYPNFPNETKEIQRRLDELVSRMAIVYLFAVFDEYATDSMIQAIPEDRRHKFKAYRHVRNSAAHGVLFKRSPRKDNSYHAYEAVMRSSSPLPNIVYDNVDLICANTGIELQCRTFMEELLGLIIGRMESA